MLRIVGDLARFSKHVRGKLSGLAGTYIDGCLMVGDEEFRKLTEKTLQKTWIRGNAPLTTSPLLALNWKHWTTDFSSIMANRSKNSASYPSTRRSQSSNQLSCPRGDLSHTP